MDKTLIVAQHELRTMLKRPGYRVMTAMVPVILALVLIGVGVFQWIQSEDEPEARVVAYLDQSGIINGFEEQGLTTFRAYPDEASATQALLAGDVDAVYVIPADYLESGVVVEITEQTAGIGGGGGAGPLRNLLINNLVADSLVPERAARVASPISLTTVEVDGAGGVADDPLDVGRLLFCFAVAGLVIFSVFSITGYLLQGLNEEKENRIMEILLSSISPDQLMLGKLLGLGLAGIVQMGIWVGAAVLFGAVFFLAVGSSGLPELNAPPPSVILVAVLVFLLGYAYFGSLMAALGAITTSQRESQQITAVVILPAVVPFWLLPWILGEPDGTLARVLTFFPFTAPTVTLARLGLDAIGPIETVLSLATLAAVVFLVVRLTQRLFRTYLLVFTQRPSLLQMLKTLIRGTA